MLEFAYTLNFYNFPSEALNSQAKKQSLVTHTRLSHGVTRNPAFTTFFTIKTCHLFIYGDIFCTWRNNEAFLSSFSIVPEQFYY